MWGSELHLHLLTCIFPNLPEIRQADLRGNCGEREHGKEKILLASLVLLTNAGFHEIHFLFKKMNFHLLVLLQPSIACLPQLLPGWISGPVFFLAFLKHHQRGPEKLLNL